MFWINREIGSYQVNLKPQKNDFAHFGCKFALLFLAQNTTDHHIICTLNSSKRISFHLFFFVLRQQFFPQKIIMYLSNAEFHISDTFWHLYALLHLHCEFKLKIKQTNVYIYTKLNKDKFLNVVPILNF